MLAIIDGFGDDVVAVRGTGLVSADDYDTVLTPAIAAASAGGRKVRLLLDYGEGFEGYETSAILADSTFGAGHLGSFERVAIVTDADWLRRAIHVFGGLIPGDVRLFSTADGADARAWIES